MSDVYEPPANVRVRSGKRVFVLAALLALLAVAAPVRAQESDTPEQVVIFVLDLSGSMNAPFDGEKTKLDVAKEAFAEAFTVTGDHKVGLRVYGDQFASAPPAERERNCMEDTRSVVPAEGLDRESLISQVQGFTAQGDTPIALALRAADEEDVPGGALATIVLFSDGRDECFDADLNGTPGDPGPGPSWGEDPCDVAREIANKGTDLRIDRVNTVGFGVDEAGETELKCIANDSGGNYTPIETPEDARVILPELLKEYASFREPERLGGEAIVGTPGQDGAPSFTAVSDHSEGGRYTDSIEMGAEKWYRAPEIGSGEGQITVTAFSLPAQEGITLDVRAYLPETDQTFFGNACRNGNAGVPRRLSVSVGCSRWIQGGPHDHYWIVSLTSEDEALEDSYDLELLLSGPNFGGADTQCAEPQACWYEQELDLAIDRLGELTDDPEKFEEVVALQDDAAQARSAADEAEAKLAALNTLAEEQGSGGLLPLLLGLLGVALGGASFLVSGRGKESVDADAVLDTPGTGEAVVGEVLHEPAEEAAGADDDGPTTRAEEGATTKGSGEKGAASETGTSSEARDSEPDPATPDEPETQVPKPDADTDEAGDGPAAPEIVAGATEVPEPGWYADLDEDGVLRWWDGNDWTDQTRADEGGDA